MDSVSISARFNVTDVDSHEEMENITMEPVISDDPNDPNHTYSQYTPSGKLELTVTNPALIGQVRPGQTYDILMTPYVPDVPADDASDDDSGDDAAVAADTDSGSDDDADAADSASSATSSTDSTGDAAASDDTTSVTDADSSSSDTSASSATDSVAATADATA